MKKVQPRPVAAISGASAGIGSACAIALARAGYALALGARRGDRLSALAATIRREFGDNFPVWHHQLDVTEKESIDTFHGACLAEYGHVDVLVNNAGLAAGLSPVTKGDDADWRAMIETNVYGLLCMTRRFLPDMLAQNQGHIVNIGSIAGITTYANGAVYAATKHGVRAISGALRLELNGTPIRVSEIDPGMVESEFSLVRLKDADKAKAVYAGMQPLTPADIADTVVFCVNRPAHVNIDQIVIMATDQASVGKVHRR